MAPTDLAETSTEDLADAAVDPELDDAAEDLAPDRQSRSSQRQLDPDSARLLAFERQWWRRAGAKEQAIRDTFGLSPIRYYQWLNRLLDEPAALAHDPLLVSRLRRLRATRTR